MAKGSSSASSASSSAGSPSGGQDPTQNITFFIFTALFGAFAYLLALAWDSAVQTAINSKISDPANVVKAQFIYAIIVTLIAIIGVIILNKVYSRFFK